MPIYEYECECGEKSEEFKPMDKRHDAVCLRCGKVPRLLISRLAKRNPFDQRMPFTVYNHDGSVVGKRYDLKPTPQDTEYYDFKKIREDQLADVEKEALCQR